MGEKSKKTIFNCSTECVSYAFRFLLFRLPCHPRNGVHCHYHCGSCRMNFIVPAVTYLCRARYRFQLQFENTDNFTLLRFARMHAFEYLCFSRLQNRKKIHFKIYSIHLSTHFGITYIYCTHAHRLTHSHSHRQTYTYIAKFHKVKDIKSTWSTNAEIN